MSTCTGIINQAILSLFTLIETYPYPDQGDDTVYHSQSGYTGQKPNELHGVLVKFETHRFGVEYRADQLSFGCGEPCKLHQTEVSFHPSVRNDT